MCYIHVHVHENTCIAQSHCKVVAEEEKKGRNPDPTNYTHDAQTNTHEMNRTLTCPVRRGLKMFYG